MPYASRFVGIDISKSFLDVCLLPDQKRGRFANTSEGTAAFIAFLAPLAGVERLILEPTGGYGRLVVTALPAAALPDAKVHGSRLRPFARACGPPSQTDTTDAF